MDLELEKHRFDIALEDLQTFIAVANLGGFNRAARHLNLSQPSISNRVRRLEEKLSVRLLSRTRHKVELTERGRLLHAQATDALAGLSALLQRFHDEKQGRRRYIDLASTALISMVALPPLLGAFAEHHPGVTVRLQEFPPEEAMHALIDGRCEIAVMACDNLPDTLEHELLVIDHCVAVMAVGHPLHKPEGVTLEEAAAHPILGSEFYMQANHVLQAEARRRGLNLRLVQQAQGVKHPMTMFAMAAAGLGVLIYPRSLVLPELASTVAMVPFVDCDIQRRYGIVWSKDREPTHSAQQLRRFLNEQRRPDADDWPAQAPRGGSVPIGA